MCFASSVGSTTCSNNQPSSPKHNESVTNMHLAKRCAPPLGRRWSSCDPACIAVSSSMSMPRFLLPADSGVRCCFPAPPVTYVMRLTQNMQGLACALNHRRRQDALRPYALSLLPSAPDGHLPCALTAPPDARSPAE